MKNKANSDTDFTILLSKIHERVIKSVLLGNKYEIFCEHCYNLLEENIESDKVTQMQTIYFLTTFIEFLMTQCTDTDFNQIKKWYERE